MLVDGAVAAHLVEEQARRGRAVVAAGVEGDVDPRVHVVGTRVGVAVAVAPAPPVRELGQVQPELGVGGVGHRVAVVVGRPVPRPCSTQKTPPGLGTSGRASHPAAAKRNSAAARSAWPRPGPQPLELDERQADPGVVVVVAVAAEAAADDVGRIRRQLRPRSSQ